MSYYQIKSSAEDANVLDKLGDIAPAGVSMQNVQLLIIAIFQFKDYIYLDQTCCARHNLSDLANTAKRGMILSIDQLERTDIRATQKRSEEIFFHSSFFDKNTWVEADDKVADPANEPWRKYYMCASDSIYCTEDLGHCLNESGNCAITGRANSQIKIREFSTELNETDSNLRGCQFARKYKMLLPRGRDKEPTLVSYIVPELQE